MLIWRNQRAGLRHLFLQLVIIAGAFKSVVVFCEYVEKLPASAERKRNTVPTFVEMTRTQLYSLPVRVPALTQALTSALKSKISTVHAEPSSCPTKLRV